MKHYLVKRVIEFSGIVARNSRDEALDASDIELDHTRVVKTTATLLITKNPKLYEEGER